MRQDCDEIGAKHNPLESSCITTLFTTTCYHSTTLPFWDGVDDGVCWCMLAMLLLILGAITNDDDDGEGPL